jgi:insertion element IS1 protein InsB
MRCIVGCIVGWDVVSERPLPVMQALVDHAVPARQYYSDQFPVSSSLVYSPGQRQALPNKSQTYSVEADNAELRHYLARLGRRSRCFSRSVTALRQAIQLFVDAWNQRQLARRAHPQYPVALRSFAYPYYLPRLTIAPKPSCARPMATATGVTCASASCSPPHPITVPPE